MGIRESEELLDLLAIRIRMYQMIHGDAFAQEKERRKQERNAVPNNRHERRKRAAIERRTR